MVKLLGLTLGSLIVLVVGVQVFRGRWLSLLARNVLADAASQQQVRSHYRGYGIFLMLIAVALWGFYFI